MNKFKFTIPEIYIPRKGSRNIPDLSRPWFVFYHFQDPATGKMKRFKVYEGINRYKNLSDRLSFAKELQKAIKDLLLIHGFNPFSKDNKMEEELSLVPFAVETYLKYQANRITESSYSILRSRLTTFVKYLETKYPDIAINKVSTKIILEFLDYLVSSGKVKAGKTVNLYRGFLSGFFNYLLSLEDPDLIKINPVLRIERRKTIKQGNRPYTDKEFDSILAYTNDNNIQLNRMIRFIYYSCLRPGKEARLCQIKHIEIHPKGNRILIPALNSKTGRILGENQYIPLDTFLYEMLDKEMNIFSYPPDYYIFSTDGTPGPHPVNINYWSKPFQKMRQDLGLSPENTLYSAKHTRCCHLFLDGEPFERIRQLTRHSNNAILQDYLKGLGLMISETVTFKSRRV